MAMMKNIKFLKPVEIDGDLRVTGDGHAYVNGEKVATLKDISTVYRYKGSVSTYAALPKGSTASVGDVYNVTDENGMNYAWDGEKWDSLGGSIDLSNYLLKQDAVGVKTSGGGERFNHYANEASGTNSHAEGRDTIASNEYAHAEGKSTVASARASHAEGDNTSAKGAHSHSEGSQTIAEGHSAHAEGMSTRAGGTTKPTENADTSEGYFSHSEGNGTWAKGNSSHAEGLGTEAKGIASHAEGHKTAALRQGSHSEGISTIASEIGTHAEGVNSLAGGTSKPSENTDRIEGYFAHAEGNATWAKGNSAHAEGIGTEAQGIASHAEGLRTTAGEGAHAEGDSTKATGTYSHAEGQISTASGLVSHAEGHNTTASAQYAHAEGYGTSATGNQSHAEGNNTTASGTGSHAEGAFSKATGATSHAEGNTTEASGNNSHSEGANTKATNNVTHAEGNQSIASGEESHAEGYGTTSSGKRSHSQGSETKAYGYAAHSEGIRTRAGTGTETTAPTPHSEKAEGYFSHAEGNGTWAKGNSSHAGGIGTIASAQAQTAIGKYNQENANALFIVGNGTGTNARSNAFEVISDDQGCSLKLGNIELKGWQLRKLQKFLSSLEANTVKIVPVVAEGGWPMLKYRVNGGQWTSISTGVDVLKDVWDLQFRFTDIDSCSLEIRDAYNKYSSYLNVSDEDDYTIESPIFEISDDTTLYYTLIEPDGDIVGSWPPPYGGICYVNFRGTGVENLSCKTGDIELGSGGGEVQYLDEITITNNGSKLLYLESEDFEFKAYLRTDASKTYMPYKEGITIYVSEQDGLPSPDTTLDLYNIVTKTNVNMYYSTDFEEGGVMDIGDVLVYKPTGITFYNPNDFDVRMTDEHRLLGVSSATIRAGESMTFYPTKSVTINDSQFVHFYI